MPRAWVIAAALGVTALLNAADSGSRPAGFTLDRVMYDLRQTHPNATRVSNELPPAVKAFENVTYVSRDGTELKLDLYRPTGNALLPGVIIVHGGGWEMGDRTMERPLAKHLAARGYVAVPVSYRLGPAGRYPGALEDLRTAVEWLKAHAADYGILRGRIGAVGGSAGGQLVALLGARNDPASGVQAVVDIDGLANFADPVLIAHEAQQPGAPTRFLGGSYVSRTQTWVEASALSHVSSRSAPCLFIDSTVTSPILPGREQMSAALRALGIDSRVVQIPGTPHPFWLVHPWFERTLDLTDGFLRKHLKGGETPGRQVRGATVIPDR